MTIHVIMGRVLWVGCVNVETSSSTKVPICIFALYAGTTRRGIREKNRNPLRGSRTQEGTFLSPETKGQPSYGKEIGLKYPLSSVQVRPARYVNKGTLLVELAPGGRKRLKFAETPPRVADCEHCKRINTETELIKYFEFVLNELAFKGFVGRYFLEYFSHGRRSRRSITLSQVFDVIPFNSVDKIRLPQSCLGLHQELRRTPSRLVKFLCEFPVKAVLGRDSPLMSINTHSTHSSSDPPEYLLLLPCLHTHN